MTKEKIIIFLILLLVIGGITYFLMPYTMYPKVVYVSEIVVTDETINLQGGIATSADNFIKHSARYKDGNLYITIKGHMFRGDSGSIDVSIKNDFNNLENIYLEGGEKPEDNELIWNKDKGAINE